MSLLNFTTDITEKASNAMAIRNCKLRISQMDEFSYSDPEMFRDQVDMAYDLLVHYSNGHHNDLCIDYFDRPYIDDDQLNTLESFSIKHMGRVSYEVEKVFYKPEVRNDRATYCCFCIVAAFSHLLSCSAKSEKRRIYAHKAVSIINRVYPNNPFVQKRLPSSIEDASNFLDVAEKEAYDSLYDINRTENSAVIFDDSQLDAFRTKILKPNDEHDSSCIIRKEIEDWWYSIKNEKYGPTSQEELVRIVRSNALENETLVWREGMTNWEKILNVQELSIQLSQTPPPLPYENMD